MQHKAQIQVALTEYWVRIKSTAEEQKGRRSAAGSVNLSCKFSKSRSAARGKIPRIRQAQLLLDVPLVEVLITL